MPLIVDLIDRKIGVNPSTAIAGSIPYDKNDFPASFPYARWVTQLQRYGEYWRWFTGEIWEEEVRGGTNKNDEPLFRFPLKINLIKTAAMKHAYVLFGEVPEGPEPMVPIRCIPDPKTNQKDTDAADKQKAKELQYFLNDVWTDNNGRVLQMEGGLVQQPLGGIVYRVGWNWPNPELKYGIKLEMVLPDFFMPVWDSSNPDDLLEAFIVWRVPAREAVLKYELDLHGVNPDYLLYIEHWTKKTVSITVGGHPISYTVELSGDDGQVIDSETIKFQDYPNPFGFVPMVYIPRERSGGYYGLSIVEDLKGLAKEINARMADMGDVINETSHREIFVRNIPATIRTRDIGGLRPVTDLGVRPPGTQGEPDAFSIDPPKMSDNLVNYSEILRKQFLRDAFISSVAEGEDEGSQRSALTLAFRMWPITSKARAMRAYWENGLIRFNKMIAKIAAMHPDITGITEDHLKNVKFYCEWASQIPRDREQLVNEVTLLLQTESLSPYTALQILGTVQDPAEEIEKVKAWMDFKNQQATNLEMGKQKAKTAVQAPIASTGLDNK